MYLFNIFNAVALRLVRNMSVLQIQITSSLSATAAYNRGDRIYGAIILINNVMQVSVYVIKKADKK
ncbi:MAG: hypothetical protein ACJAYG_001605 [Oceanicoccus sp.]|jgi:hypothetical protein